MAKHNTQISISWEQAVVQVVVDKKARKQEQLHYWKEFRESWCDIFDMADFEHYAEMTGLKLKTILFYARYREDDAWETQMKNELLSDHL